MMEEEDGQTRLDIPTSYYRNGPLTATAAHIYTLCNTQPCASCNLLSMPGMGHHLAFSKLIPHGKGSCVVELLALAAYLSLRSLYGPCMAPV